MSDAAKVFYRYEDYSDEGYCGIRLEVYEFRVLSTTPKGVWIDRWGTKRFVLLDARKRFACPTKAEALTSYIKRKERQIRILNSQIEYARQALELAEDEQSGANPPCPTRSALPMVGRLS